nr:MAG TPA: DDB1- and CUL4-associated factor 15 ligase [Caudoviricetes sp.]
MTITTQKSNLVLRYLPLKDERRSRFVFKIKI